jgi:hypothetical protein
LELAKEINLLQVTGWPQNYSIGPTKRKIGPGTIDFDSIISQGNEILLI